MTRLMAMGMVLGLFVVGVLTGGFSVQLFHDFHGQDGERRAVRNGHPARFMERLERDLELTPEQRTELEQILHDAFLEGEAMRREFLPKVHEHMNATREKIHSVLTPEQRAKFAEVHERHRGMAERFLLGHGKRRRGGKPHGPPPPPPGD
jgi:Spy/CpxP family protein refolding chaperone